MDDADLLALLDEEPPDTEFCTCTVKCEAGEVNENCPLCEKSLRNCTAPEAAKNDTETPEEKPKSSIGSLMILLVLALAGTLLFSTFRDKIEHWEYPQRFTEYVEYYAGKYGIDPMILYAFIRTESNFDPNADSDAGARGLMQITEVTFDWIKMKIAPKESLTFDDLYDPETNIRFGSYFVSYCLDRYSGHLATAAAAYHSGVGTVDGLLGQEAYSPDGVTLDHYPYPQMRLYVKNHRELSALLGDL
mgnify:CR=1 FL=1